MVVLSGARPWWVGCFVGSVDAYAFVKNAYFQNLEFRVTDGKSGEKVIKQEELDDFEEFESMLDDLDLPEEQN